MAHCPPELLDDLADVFANVRTWPGVIEKRPGVFYAHKRPFLHFHLLSGRRRRGDVKGHTNWVQLDLPRPVSATRQRALLRGLQMCYGDKVEPKSCVKRGHRTPRTKGPKLTALVPAAERAPLAR